jgi:hypothetical protein
MAAIARAFYEVVSAKSLDIDILRTVALIFCAGLLAWLLLTEGLAYLHLAPLAPDVMDWI